MALDRARAPHVRRWRGFPPPPSLPLLRPALPLQQRRPPRGRDTRSSPPSRVRCPPWQRACCTRAPQDGRPRRPRWRPRRRPSGVTAAADRAGRHAARRTRRCTDRRAVARPWLGRWCGVEWDVRPGGRSPVTERTHLCGGGSRRPARRTPPAQATVAVRLGGEGVLMSLAGGGGPGELSERVFFLCLLSFRGFLYEGPGGQMICPRLLGWHAPRLFVALCARFNLE